MNQILFRGFVLLIAIFLLAFNITRVGAVNGASSAPVQKAKTDDIEHQVVGRKLDPKAEVLSKYLAKHDSPLQYHAQDFVDAANEYGLDWKLVAAISGVESTFGKAIPGGFNGWGWGVYGNQAIYFNSWKDAIYTVSAGLKQNYIDKGLIDPYQINRIYASSPYWGGKVTYFMNDIEKYSESYQSEQPISEIIAPASKVAANSGKLAVLD